MIWRNVDLGEVALVHLALLGEQGRPWYADSLESIKLYSARHHFDPGIVCDVLAILSPRVTVEYSIKLAHEYLTTGEPNPGTMKQRQAALERYKVTGVFNGPKVNAFAKALRGDPDAVVIDAWMYRALREGRTTPKAYREASAKVRAVARRLGWRPAETQAAIWAGARAYVGYASEYSPMDLGGL